MQKTYLALYETYTAGKKNFNVNLDDEIIAKS